MIEPPSPLKQRPLVAIFKICFIISGLFGGALDSFISSTQTEYEHWSLKVGYHRTEKCKCSKEIIIHLVVPLFQLRPTHSLDDTQKSRWDFQSTYLCILFHAGDRPHGSGEVKAAVKSVSNTNWGVVCVVCLFFVCIPYIEQKWKKNHTNLFGFSDMFQQYLNRTFDVKRLHRFIEWTVRLRTPVRTSIITPKKAFFFALII